MATVPKLTYAKIGKGPKAKMESASSELPRNRDEKSEDLFSQMNQDNLKYIQKELKLKKNRSEQQPSKSAALDFHEIPQRGQQQAMQKDKLYNKYRRNEEVTQRESHLQQTERLGDHEKPYLLVFNEQFEDHCEPAEKLNSQERETKQAQSTRPHPPQSKIHQSMPSEERQRRFSSIQNFVGEGMSINLNRQEGGLFIQFLQGYISDLNQSRHIITKPNEDHPGNKFEQMRDSKQKQNSKNKLGQQKKYLGQELKVDLKKLAKIKKSSDTFGEPNSKFTLKSQSIKSQPELQQLQLQFKQEKLNNLYLAKEIQKLRQLLEIKQNIIKRLEVQNQLFQEQILHLQKKQEILNRDRKSSQNLRDFNFVKNIGKMGKIVNDQNLQHRDTNYHYRNASANIQKAAMSYRSSFRVFEDFAELFQNSNYLPKKENRRRQKLKKKQNESLQRWQKEYGQFLQTQKRGSIEVRGKPKAYQTLY